MQVFKILLIMLSFVSIAQAQRSTAQNEEVTRARAAYDRALAAANESITRNTTVRSNAQAEFDRIQRQVNEAQAKLTAAQAKVDSQNGAYGGLQRLWKDPDPQALVDRNKAQTDLDALNAQLEKARTDLTTATTNLTAATTELQRTNTTISTAEQNTNSVFQGITTAINSGNLLGQISQLQLRGQNMKHAVEIMGMKYDNTLMGYYVRAQIAQTLQSDLLCKATTQCKGSGDTPRLNENDFDSLIKRAPFKNAGPVPARSSGTR